MQLPQDSRTIVTINPARDWNWDRETQSQILRELGLISDQISKFGSGKKTKVPPQFQPAYVERAKREFEERKQLESRISEADLENLKSFWKHRNPGVHYEDN